MIFAASLAYSFFFIDAYAFTFDGHFQFPLFDDGMISLEYARNLARSGSFSVGLSPDQTAGFTSYGWVGLLAALIATRVGDASTITIAVIVLNLLFLTAAIAVYLMTIGAAFGARARLLFVALIATAPSVLFWTLRGMEVPLAMFFIAALYALTVSSTQNSGSRQIRWLIVMVAGTPFMRPELLSINLAIVIILFSYRQAGRALLVLAASCGGLTVYLSLNYILFGQLFSNSYYLKVTGVTLFARVQRGLDTMGVQAVAHAPYIFLFACLIFLGIIVRQREAFQQSLLAVQHSTRRTIAAVFFFVILVNWLYIGGDAWEEFPFFDRFVAPGLPLLALWLLLEASLDLDTADSQALRWRNRVAIVGCVAVVIFNAINAFNLIGFGARGDKRFSYLGLLMGKTFPPGTIVLHYWFGQPSYYSALSGIRSIDGLGKIDEIVAKSSPKTRFKPGHDRWNHEHSIGHLQPDLIVNMPCPSPHDTAIDCNGVWDEITARYGYVPFTAPGKDWTIFVNSSRLDLQAIVPAFTAALSAHERHER
jgi:hypothetical protein